MQARSSSHWVESSGLRVVGTGMKQLLVRLFYLNGSPLCAVHTCYCILHERSMNPGITNLYAIALAISAAKAKAGVECIAMGPCRAIDNTAGLLMP